MKLRIVPGPPARAVVVCPLTLYRSDPPYGVKGSGTAMSPHHHDDAPAPEAETATDPVCGMQVEIKEGARRRDYGDETFHFCSEGCQKKFDADPYFYASGNAEKARERAQPGTQYTCPMHP